MGLDDACFRDPESVSVSQNDADEWQRYEEAEYHRSISTITLSIREDHIAKVVDHSEALDCIHDLKGEVVMHERRRI